MPRPSHHAFPLRLRCVALLLLLAHAAATNNPILRMLHPTPGTHTSTAVMYVSATVTLPDGDVFTHGPPCTIVLFNGRPITQGCAKPEESGWTYVSAVDATPGYWMVKFLVHSLEKGSAIFPHASVPGVENPQSGLQVDDDDSTSNPTRVAFLLVGMELRNHRNNTIARTPDVVVWVHPTRFKPDTSTTEDSHSQGNWMPGQSSAASKLNVALHSQSMSSKVQFVAGSEITTNGIAGALQQLPNIGKIGRFAPYSYDALQQERWDLVIIEGYMATVPNFIASIRRGNPLAVVLFVCLDTYPTPHLAHRLDVDGFLTNSALLQQHVLSLLAPTRFMALAVNPDQIGRTAGQERYRSNVAFLGHNSVLKANLHAWLQEAAQFGLAIYGGNWLLPGSGTDYSEYTKGVLPAEDIADLYSSVSVVIGTTDVIQRELGMVNNHVFEALSCGAVVISDCFPELVDLFGDHVLCATEPGDVTRHLQRLLNGNLGELQHRSAAGQAFVHQHHTWGHRVQGILGFYADIRADMGMARTLRKKLLPVAARPGVSSLSETLIRPQSGTTASAHAAQAGSASDHQQRNSLMPTSTLPPLYRRPNRPLVGVLFDATAPPSGLHGPDVSSGSGYMPFQSLSDELTHLFGQSVFQQSFRVHLIPLQPHSSSSADRPVPRGTYPAILEDMSAPSHPLHRFQHRYQILLGVGSDSGIVLPTLQAWNNRTAQLALPFVRQKLTPRSVFYCTEEGQAVAHDLQSVRVARVVSVWAKSLSDGVVPPCWTQSDAESSGHGDITQASWALLGPADIFQPSLAFQRAKELRFVLAAALIGSNGQPPWIEVLQPSTTERYALEDGPVRFTAKLHNADSPDDVAWAVLLDGHDLGDRTSYPQFQLDLKYFMEVGTICAGFIEAAATGQYPVCEVQVQFLLRDSFYRAAVFTSRPVVLSLYSRVLEESYNLQESERARHAIAYPASTFPASSAVLYAPGSEEGGRLLDLGVATGLQQLVNMGANPTNTVLSLGCYRGEADPLQSVSAGTSMYWLRLASLNLHCNSLSEPADNEAPLTWLRNAVSVSSVLEKAMLLPEYGCSSAPVDLVLASKGSRAVQADEEHARAVRTAGIALRTPTGERVTSYIYNESSFHSAIGQAQRARRLQTGQWSSSGIIPAEEFDRSPSPHTDPATAHAVWDISNALGLRSLPSNSVRAVTVHWALTFSDATFSILAQVYRVLAPGGTLRIVEPDFRLFQVPARRIGAFRNYVPTLTTPKHTAHLLTKAGFINATTLRVDRASDPHSLLSVALFMDTYDAEDARLLKFTWGSDAAGVYCIEAQKPV